MQYMHSLFIKYMETCTKSFPIFLNPSGVNGVDICDVTFTVRWGHISVTICDQGGRKCLKRLSPG